jgi:hypothetical protein
LSPMPPSATDSALSPLSSSFPELIPGLVVLSAAPRRTGPEWKLRGCYSTRTQYVRYAICRGRRKILQQCWRSPLRPLLGHNTVVSFCKGRRLPGSLLDVGVGVLRAPMAAVAGSRTPLRSVCDLQPPPSRLTGFIAATVCRDSYISSCHY